MGYRQGSLQENIPELLMSLPKSIYLLFKVSLKVDKLIKHDVFPAVNTTGGSEYFEFLTLLCIEDNMFDS